MTPKPSHEGQCQKELAMSKSKPTTKKNERPDEYIGAPDKFDVGWQSMSRFVHFFASVFVRIAENGDKRNCCCHKNELITVLLSHELD
jgi:hypothetical protein